MAKEQIVLSGPYGGGGGQQWDDGTYSTIRELTIHSELEIISIQVVYDDIEGKPVELSYPTECILSISGHYGYNAKKYLIVKSLTIQSNMKQYGPYGKEEGTRFTTPVAAGKVVGLFGRSANLLDSIGVYLEPSHQIHATTPFGPFGGAGGQHWDDGIYSTVRELIIHSTTDIISIQVVYDDIEGNSISGKKHGGDDGTPNSVKLDYPSEYLLSVPGYHGYSTAHKYHVVKSLRIQSNMKQYGPYGEEKGTYFITPVTTGKIVGFFGRNGSLLDSIGVYIKPFQTSTLVGPFGTTSGQQWDDGTYNTVRELIIYSGWVIDSIQVVYNDIDGKPISGKKHGGNGGQRNEVKFDKPDEFLISVSGYFGQVDNMVAIRSLEFQSNKTKYGPFGMEKGEKFEVSSTGGKIIGFH
ncbi:jacalin-related lectin 3-like [Cornus florida]|uniref:jacalin-related lectin 3-like n=1 Tax=Cornus florida TaxID=4283 RepID=UPI00289C5B4D|nr:jacalin-related lectin 3-like [Cornus florida]